jgi:hypothetical protein
MVQISKNFEKWSIVITILTLAPIEIWNYNNMIYESN